MMWLNEDGPGGDELYLLECSTWQATSFTIRWMRRSTSITELAVQSDIINTLHYPAIEIVVPRPKLSISSAQFPASSVQIEG